MPASENPPAGFAIVRSTDGDRLAPGLMLGANVDCQSMAAAAPPTDEVPPAVLIDTVRPLTVAVMLPPRLSEPARPLPVTAIQ